MSSTLFKSLLSRFSNRFLLFIRYQIQRRSRTTSSITSSYTTSSSLTSLATTTSSSPSTTSSQNQQQQYIIYRLRILLQRRYRFLFIRHRLSQSSQRTRRRLVKDKQLTTLARQKGVISIKQRVNVHYFNIYIANYFVVQSLNL